MAVDIFHEEEDVIAQINIVPFVDIVLVLLIIFMLTSSAIERASIPVDLPTAANAGESVASTLNIVLDAEGALYLNGQPIDHEGLARFVAQLAGSEPDAQAVISADKTVDYGHVIKVIDVVKGNGVKTFALNIQREI